MAETTLHVRPGPGTTSRRGRRSGLCVCVAAVSALCACGSSTPVLDAATIERAIAGSILTQHHLHATVACPSNVPRKAGLRFACAASLDVGQYPVTVTEVNNHGHVIYRNKDPLVVLNIAKVEHSIGRSIFDQRRVKARVRCPSEVLQKAHVAFTCLANLNGRERQFAVTEIDGGGHVRYVERFGP